MYLSAEKVLVGLSRVQTLQHLRIIPFAPGQTDNHLHSLRPNEVMLHWFAGYGNDGFWSAQNSAQSIAKNPLSSKKQSKTKSSVNSTKKASSSSSTPSKKVPNTSDTNLPRVVKQFRLNAAHSLPADSTKLFHAFFVPGDGNCLFHSFKSALHLMTSVSILRRQVVDLISDESDPMKRLSTMNAHIAREQEFHNPAYNDVDLFDAGSINSPGQMDIRFSTLWAQYSDEMLSTAWVGTQLSFYFLLYLFHFPLFQVNLKSWLFVKFSTLTALSGNYANSMLRSFFSSKVQGEIYLSICITRLDDTMSTPIFQRSLYFNSLK
jgi:hypothetical protein